MSAPEHHPGGNAGWLIASITGAFSLLRSLLSRREAPPESEEELAAAASRGGHRAIILARLSELEGRVERLESAVDRIERALNDFRSNMQREMEDIMHALRMRNS